MREEVPDSEQLGVLTHALECLASGDREEAAAIATSLKVTLPERRKRRPFTPETTVAVWRRDQFSCRYCGQSVIPPPVLRATSLVWPDAIPYHPNWRTDVTHPLYLLRSATVDHVEPHAHGGSHDDLGNLATACWPCNTRKGDLPGWALVDAPVSDWDGLVGFYPALWAAGEPVATPTDIAYHRPWLRAFATSNLQDGPENAS
jgi:5-methylcytosine-specific restriction endonuclease McrA